MRIGDFAAKVGITTRMIRHYHRRGVLPEPPRGANGYRDYDLDDVVRLVRLRRLLALRVSLDDAASALRSASGSLADLLATLDDDLARQEADLRQRRRRLTKLIARGVNTADDLGSDDVAALVDGLGLSERDRGLVAVADDTGSPTQRRWLRQSLSALSANPAVWLRTQRLQAEVDNLDPEDADGGITLAQRGVDDAAAFFPPELLQAMRDGRTQRAQALAEIGSQCGLPPAQRAFVVESLRLLLERGDYCAGDY